MSIKQIVVLGHRLNMWSFWKRPWRKYMSCHGKIFMQVCFITNKIMISVCIRLEGDLVYLNPCNKPGISTKLQPIYKGPFLIIKRYSPVLYMVQDRKCKFVVHHDRLLICHDRFIPLRMRKNFVKSFGLWWDFTLWWSRIAGVKSF